MVVGRRVLYLVLFKGIYVIEYVVELYRCRGTLLSII